jgi:hypothetical protein
MPVPYSIMKSFQKDFSILESQGFPCFIKAASLGSSVGVYKCHNLEEAVIAAQEVFKLDSKLLVEKAIKGREIEVAILGSDDMEASLAGEVIPHHDFYSYEAKYLDENGASFEAPAKNIDHDLLKQIALKAAKALEIQGMARVDFFVTEENTYYINEINANIIGTNLLNIKNIYYNDSFAPLSFTINSETKITTTITTTGNIPVVIKSVTVIDCFGKLYKFTTVADNSLDNKTFTTLGTKNNNLSYTSVSMIPGNRLGNNISINSKVVKNSNPDVIPASTQVDQAVNAIKYGRGGKTIFGNIGTNTNGDTRLGQIQGQTLSPFLSRNKF